VLFGKEVDDRREARFLIVKRDEAECQENEQQPDIDCQRKHEPGRSPAERRPVVRRGEPIGRQAWWFSSGVALRADLSHPRLEPKMKAA
jgi:hypothetical protein